VFFKADCGKKEGIVRVGFAMKFSLRWLSHYVELSVPVAEMLEKLTLSGTEVEQVTTTGVAGPHVVVAQILSSAPHPNADRLRVCQVADGGGTRQIVCGAKNYRDGDKVPLALPGAKLPGGLTIKESKLRGELSQGMLCSAKELALAEDAEGLLLLPADAPVGTRTCFPTAAWRGRSRRSAPGGSSRLLPRRWSFLRPIPRGRCSFPILTWVLIIPRRISLR
jgi:tRNA-binding EMAP/Myf-like protein